MGLDNLRKLPVKLDPNDHGYSTKTAEEEQLELERAMKKAPAVSNPLLRACPSCGARKGQRCRTVSKNKPKPLTRSSPIVHATRLQGTTDAA